MSKNTSPVPTNERAQSANDGDASGDTDTGLPESDPTQVPDIAGRIIGIEQYNGRVLVATELMVFELKGRQLFPLTFEQEPEPEIQIVDAAEVVGLSGGGE